MPTDPRLSVLRSIALLACILLCGCSAFETARVVSLDDAPVSECVRRPEGDAPAPSFVDTTGAIVAKRQLKTAISVEPALETYVERTLEGELGLDVERLRVDFVGYRYAYSFPSREDDFVLRVELEARGAGIRGEFEGVVRGVELREPSWLLGPNWWERIPDTGAGRAEDDQTRALEGRADQRAWLHRALLREATRRLVVSLAAR